MSYTKAQGRTGPILKCDLCPEPVLGEPSDSSRFFRDYRVNTITELRREAKKRGWRRDKLNRDICPRHPKLKGAKI